VSSKQSWREFGQVFDGVAEAYDRVRSGYPPELVERATVRGRLSAGSRVLEIGCGTGKLTELLAAHDLDIDAVDPGANMIAFAKRRVGPDAQVRFHVGRFEDVDLPEGAFEAVFSATAFHWVDPAIGWAKAAACLRPGGTLALLQYTDVRDDLTGAIDDAFLEVLREHAPEVVADWRSSRSLDALLRDADVRRGNVSELWDSLGDQRHRLTRPEAAMLFADVEIDHAVATIEQTADELLDVFRTTSLYHRLDPEARSAVEQADREIVDAAGGTVSFTLATLLVTARRV
jgi:ubiquinone/menaquinone biosynthesis C-methylase UbiE